MGFDVDWFEGGHLKIAEVASVSSVDDLKKTLQVGDILYTKPRENEGVLHKAFYAVESAVQGSPYTHVGLYVGDGKIVDAGEWKSGRKTEHSTGVHAVDLDTFVDRYNFKVLRVDAPSDTKQDAAAYAKNQVGKEFNFKGMFRLALPFQGSPEKKDRLRKDLAESFFCSELVANAYSPVNLAAKKKLHHIMPGDIYRSSLTKTVAQYDKEASMRFSDIHSARARLLKTAQALTHQQETEWTCSAACLRAALLHLGYDLPEAELAAVIGAREGRGAETTEIVEAAKALGLDAWEQGFNTLDDAKKVLAQRIPIIADIQSFNYAGKGHYVLLCGYNENGFMVMDPNTKGATVVPNWRTVPDSKMEEIWWDRAMAPPHELMPKWGVMIRDVDNNLAKEASFSQEATAVAAKVLPAILGAGVGGYIGNKTKDETSSAARPFLGALLGGLGGWSVGSSASLLGRSNLGAKGSLAIGAAHLGSAALSGVMGAEIAGAAADMNGADEAHRKKLMIDGAALGAVMGLLSGRSSIEQSIPFINEEARRASLPSFLQGVTTKAEAKARFREQALKTHPDHGGTDAEFRALMDMWESAQNHPKFPKTASIIANSMLDELVKIGASPEAIEAMTAGAKALGLLGAGYGLVKGSDPGPDGEASGPVMGALGGGFKGALLGALIALALQRNASGEATIPKFW